jgi:hypothetical protein
MAERRNTIVCAFDPNTPKISAFDIHEWIYETFRLPDQEVNMIQIDGIKHVYTKLETEQCAHKIIQDTNGQTTYKHPDGLLSVVLIDMAGMGVKSIRIANLPPEVQGDTVRDALATYGKIIIVRKYSRERTVMR